MTTPKEPPRCADCGEIDHLHDDGTCPVCHEERRLDMEEHYGGTP